jgi:hypothetical protein
MKLNKDALHIRHLQKGPTETKREVLISANANIRTQNKQKNKDTDLLFLKNRMEKATLLSNEQWYQ